MTDDEDFNEEEHAAAAMAALEAVTAVLLAFVAEKKHPVVAAVWEPLYYMLLWALDGASDIGFCQLFISDTLNKDANFAVTSVAVGASDADVTEALKEFVEAFQPKDDEDKIESLKGGRTKCDSCDEAHPIVRTVVIADEEYVITYNDREDAEYEATGEVTDYHPPSLN